MSNVKYLQLPSEEEGLQNRRAGVTQRLHSAIKDGDRSLKNLPVFLKEALEVEAWRERTSPLGRTIANASFLEWVEADYPRGLGASVEMIRNLLRDDMEARSLLDEALGNPNGGDRRSEDFTVNNVNAERPQGNTIDAGLRRLRRAAEDRADPETGEIVLGDDRAKHLLNDVLDKRISVHAACISMGWRKATVTIVDEPEKLNEAAIKRSGAVETARAAWAAMTRDERSEFVKWAVGELTAS